MTSKAKRWCAAITPEVGEWMRNIVCVMEDLLLFTRAFYGITLFFISLLCFFIFFYF